MKHVLLVQSYKGKWGFPQGKAEKEGKEDPFDCAVREVLEEIGYDIRKKASGKFWDVMFTHPSRLYLVPDVPYSTNFRPQTRNEIRRIKWFPIESLPNSNAESYKGKWGFPQGKAEKEGKEDPFDCAVREVLEEIGYDIRKKASGKFWDVMFTHPSRLYLVPDVPYSTNFRPQTRNEIRRIKWFPIESLPNSNAE
ncbi:m7GpppN-mRNA hydrolase-like, partial [Toxorhynchites rutilus septentrionalis]|uniref:m7GpppN-mRNA hydrolase-like n=1 Tax=Toxorhynchites rutilus septentrionalis TaxID=329112 RepID=UPI002479EE56